MAVQLAGTDPEIMAEAARLAADLGAAFVDINYGCPAKKVVNKQAGSALMRDEGLAARIMEAVVRAVALPVTVKMRTGWDETSRNAPRLARIAEACGIRMVTVHGRTRCQLFRGEADWAFIRAVKDAVSIPVVANGDIRSVADAGRCLAASGADGLMIGRACQGRPWFLRQVAHFLGTGARLDVKGGLLRSFGASRIDHDELQPTSASAPETPCRVRVRNTARNGDQRIGADEHPAIGRVE